MTNPQRAVDIIIVNYKSTPLLCRCLQSITKYLKGHQIRIFVRDNSCDDSVDPLEKTFPDVRFHKHSRNIGFAAAVNSALAVGRSPYAMLLNPDSVVLGDFLTPLVDYLCQHPKVAVLGPRIYDEDGCTIQESARAYPNPLTGLFGRTSLLSRHFPNNPHSKANLLATSTPEGQPAMVDWISGACMLVRRKAYEQVGGLDTGFFMYWEDADWCRRMWRADWQVVYHPIPAVKHLVGASSDQLKLRTIIEFHRSVFRLFNKYNRAAPFMAPFVLTALFGRALLAIATKVVKGKENCKGKRYADI